MGGGAWSFLVGGAICLVNSVNERDLSLLNSYVEVCDALRCSGSHARYTDVFNESIALADRPSKRKSSARVDYVPSLCTHRPSLLPIEWSGEVFRLRRRGRFASRDVVRRMTKMLIILTSLGLEVGYAMHGFLPAKLKPRRNMRQGT
ncbi:hypothetical protein VNO77_27013 [Canavalia gladiata]|uniref:Uncharacterized protein n=1 Tax=Canavalia gladiata TaxID=3824 RepID=A0AAN9KUL2_CANGL